jgi:hypothetical protein
MKSVDTIILILAVIAIALTAYNTFSGSSGIGAKITGMFDGYSTEQRSAILQALGDIDGGFFGGIIGNQTYNLWLGDGSVAMDCCVPCTLNGTQYQLYQVDANADGSYTAYLKQDPESSEHPVSFVFQPSNVMSIMMYIGDQQGVLDRQN